jgi:hypothetical protein
MALAASQTDGELGCISGNRAVDILLTTQERRVRGGIHCTEQGGASIAQSKGGHPLHRARGGIHCTEQGGTSIAQSKGGYPLHRARKGIHCTEQGGVSIAQSKEGHPDDGIEWRFGTAAQHRD